MRWIIFFLFLIPTEILAFEDYICTIKNVQSPNQSGDLLDVEKHSIGKVFTVNRRTGITSGAVTNNYVSEPVVVDRGSKENYFKVITIMKNDITSNMYMLMIEEFSESNKKPFIFTNNMTIYHGLCEHF